MSRVAKGCIHAGLINSLKKNEEIISYQKFERYLLKTVIEILHLIQQQVPEAKQSLITQANGIAKDIINELTKDARRSLKRLIIPVNIFKNFIRGEQTTLHNIRMFF